jgi:Flp pilus assembly CpaE family ATPase
MPELSVVIVTPDNEQRAVLQVLVDGTSVARTVHSCATFPVAATDPVVRRIQAANADVVLIDIPTDGATNALRAIELLHQELPATAVFAIGTLHQPQVIVNAMRAGAREFLERPTTTTELLEAFVRLTTAQRKLGSEGSRGKLFTVVNAKGGSGATTVAVNLAVALQAAHQNVALIDLAPLGHAALHLNMKPLFTVGDAIRNLHRLDSSLLESFMTRHTDGLQVLAGANMPALVEPSTAEFARLNRFRKVPGFTEADAETAAGAKLLWKIPNSYLSVSAGIDRGVPIMQQNHTEIARSFAGLASVLTQNDIEVKRTAWSLFKTV